MPADGVINRFAKLHGDVSFERTDGSPVEDLDSPIYYSSVSRIFMGPVSGGGGGGSFSLGVSTGGNTLGLTGVTGTRVVLVGAGAITASQSRNANGATITLSAPEQSAQTQNRFNLTLNGNTAGVLQEVSSGTLSLAGGNNITISQNGNAITISGADAVTTPQSVQSIGLYAEGNTTGQSSSTTRDARSISLRGDGAVSLGFSNGSIRISAPVQSVQPETQTFVGGISASDTLYTSGTVRITGVGGGITVSTNTGQRIDLSVAAPVAQTGTQFSAGVSGGNTSGHSGTVAGRLVLAGGNNVTLSGSTNGASMSITVSAASQSVQSLGLYALGNTTGQSSSTTRDARSVSVEGAGAVSVGYSGGSLRISAPTQTVQTQNMVAVTLSGNTSGAQALISSGTLTLAGGNNITVSQNGNAITISGPNVGGAQTGISGIIASDATYTSGTVEFTGSGIVTIRSSAGQRVVVDASQSVQTAGLYALGNTVGESSSTTRDVRSISIRGDGIVSLGYSNGSLRISASQSVQPETQTFIGGISASDTLYTSGTVRITGVGGGITVSSNTGQRIDLSVAAPVNFSAGLSNLGNTDGDTGVTGTRLVLAGGQSITLSQATNANGGTITISGASTSQSVQSLGLYALGNTTGQSSSTTRDARSVSVEGAGIVSVGYSGGSLRISAVQSVQPETQTFIGGISASDTLYTSGTVRITGVGGGVTVSSNTGQRIDISVAAQTDQTLGLYAVGNTTGQSSSTTRDARTVSFRGAGDVSVGYSNSSVMISAPAQTEQTQSRFNLTISGNTAGAGALVSSGVLTLAGGNNITLSQNGNAITISGGAAGGFSGGVSDVGNTVGDTGITGSRLVLAGGNNITLSQSTNVSGGTVTISAFNQSVDTLGLYAVGNTTGQSSSTTRDARSISVDGAGIVSVGYSGGSLRISATVPAQTVQSLGMYAVQNTTAQSSSTTMDARTISIAGDGAASVGYSAGSLRISVPVQTVQTQGILSAGVSNIGNTQGNTQVSTGSRLVLAGAGEITLSQATAAGASTISISAPAQTVQTQGILSAGVSNVGNTAGNTQVSTGSRLVIAGAGIITASQATAAGASTISLSASQSAQTLGMYAVQNTTGQSSSTTMDARTLSVAGDGAVSVGYSGGSLRISAPVQTVESQSIGASNLGNTLGTSGVASGGQVRVVILGTSNITVSQSVNGASASLSLIGQPAFSAGLSNLGNTQGDTGISGTRLVLVGTNNITLSQSTDANGATVRISGQSPAGGAFSGGASDLGNTAGATGITGTQLVLVGSGNLTLSQTTGANGGTLSILNTVSAFQAGVSTGGNTAGDTGVTGTRLVLVGDSPISLSQATGANGGTITIDAPATSSLVGVSGISISTNGSTISIMQTSGSAFLTSWAPFDESPMVTGQQGQGSLHIQPIRPPGDVQFDRIGLAGQISNATNSSNSITISHWVGLYTRNASSISLLSSTSGSTNFSGSGTVGSYSLYGGPRWFTIPWTVTLTGSDYFFGWVSRTTTGGGAGHSVSQLLVSKFTNSAWSGLLGAASTATAQRLLGQGIYSATTSGMPASIAFTQITGSGSDALRMPIFMVRSGTV